MKINNYTNEIREKVIQIFEPFLTDDVIEAISSSEKVCKFLHLPLQSGSTKMLKVMNRNYTKEHT